ncbi:MAG: hypothetical protein IPK44_18105 [Candidatus Accumulibacter sp.]|jgi:hypothetical protein|uniref:hypothetical protein n=1 Tax=Candidatus Accumulibacter TaxID=327159 RepID=UPI001AD16FAF|nr:hypothetical protein [Accumulibacter sp.]MBK8116261.1 hypothetical protein [Accumulibacter sp.]MBK8386414.1 hypothetical protein [Accumulibacter sp.]MBK8577423.1 hypothetical protein [Candidatus Accumulibacter propinquus]MBN8439108.1 hypothetical protein [Accumulibacter sp.]
MTNILSRLNQTFPDQASANPALIGFLATGRGFTPPPVLPNSIHILGFGFHKFGVLAYTLRNFLS